ncbi:MAG: hypothetical protein ACLTLQ_15780 [[Clostridium] scindens]
MTIQGIGIACTAVPISRRLKEEGAGEVFIGCLDDEFAAEDEEIYKNLTKTAFQINRIYDKMLDERCPSEYERGFAATSMSMQVIP